MGRVRLSLIICSILASAVAFAQQSNDNPSNLMNYETGALANDSYSNDCLGFSFPLPSGWDLANQLVGADAKAKHVPGNTLLLLVVDQHKQGALANRILLTARDTSKETVTAQDFVANSVRSQINARPQDSSTIRDAYAVEYGGQQFFRSDYKQSQTNREPLYVAYIYTKFRGYFIGETIMAGSQEELDRAANSLQRILFQEDRVDPKCVMDSSVTDIPQRPRVSQGVATGLLANRVAPDYPSDARLARIQGQVVLQILIDRSGDVKDVSLVSGHPLLAPSAIKAVKQWKYKPYLLDGQPVAWETIVTMNFTLSLSLPLR